MSKLSDENDKQLIHQINYIDACHKHRNANPHNAETDHRPNPAQNDRIGSDRGQLARSFFLYFEKERMLS